MSKKNIWFLTGSQHLYGAEALQQVQQNSETIVKAFNETEVTVVPILLPKLVTTPEEITQTCIAANADSECIGVITWMHTFSLAKMWIPGLTLLQKPLCHLHTQFHREIPWDSIDMDFMNLNQAAHGDREAGFIHTRMRLNRKVVVGHWSDPEVQQRIGVWMRAVRGWTDLQGAKFVRFGDNMRQVAVTDGDKVSAEMQFGISVNTHGVGDLVAAVNKVKPSAVAALCADYEKTYKVAPALKKGGKKHESLRYNAKLELGLRAFLEEGDFKGYTNTFEDLHGLKQLPGLPTQRLMADGYGFGAEGDWKTAALVRAMKVMDYGLKGGTSFMEDYTYHLSPKGHQVLGSHMLEIDPAIAAGKPSCEIHPLGIGGKEDPVRLVFNAPTGNALNASLIDLGNRFRLLVNEVKAVKHPKLPKLPVARAVWECKPNFKTACQAWILAGGAHHTGYSYAVTTEMLEDFANIAGVELVTIDADTRISEFKQTLRNNEVYYHLNQGFRA